MKGKRRKRMIERALPLLPPGTQVRYIFAGQTVSIWWLVLGVVVAVLPGFIIFLLINRYRMVAVTDDAIYVIDCGAWSLTRPKRVMGVLPRATPLGPASGLWAKVYLGPVTIHVGRTFHSEVNAADAAAGVPTLFAPNLVQLSPDGAYWWDGLQWVSCESAAPAAAPRSPDGSMWWDGVRWRPVPAP